MRGEREINQRKFQSHALNKPQRGWNRKDSHIGGEFIREQRGTCNATNVAKPDIAQIYQGVDSRRVLDELKKKNSLHPERTNEQIKELPLAVKATEEKRETAPPFPRGREDQRG